LAIVSSDIDIQRLVSDLYRVRIPATRAHLLKSYLWLGPDSITVIDTGWSDSAAIARLAATGAAVAGFGHGDAVLRDAAGLLATCRDPLG
jgi:hypothetical protein